MIQEAQENPLDLPQPQDDEFVEVPTLANAEKTLTVFPCLQFGQFTCEPSDADRSCSNFSPQSLHLYS